MSSIGGNFSRRCLAWFSRLLSQTPLQWIQSLLETADSILTRAKGLTGLWTPFSYNCVQYAKLVVQKAMLDGEELYLGLFLPGTFSAPLLSFTFSLYWNLKNPQTIQINTLSPWCCQFTYSVCRKFDAISSFLTHTKTNLTDEDLQGDQTERNRIT